MDAHALRQHLEGSGLRLAVEGDGLRVEPRSALTTETRQLIRSHKAQLIDLIKRAPGLATLQADLLALIERVAAHYKTPPDELRVMIDLALKDVASARECFTATARLDGIA